MSLRVAQSWATDSCGRSSGHGLLQVALQRCSGGECRQRSLQYPELRLQQRHAQRIAPREPLEGAGLIEWMDIHLPASQPVSNATIHSNAIGSLS